MSDTDQKFKKRAREIVCGELGFYTEHHLIDKIAKAFRSVREEENEACAEVAENNAEEYYNAHQFVSKDVCYRLATAIRARLNPTKRGEGEI